MNKFSQFLFAIVIGLVAIIGITPTAVAHDQIPQHVLAKMNMQCRAEGGSHIEVRYSRPTCVWNRQSHHSSYGQQRYGYQSRPPQRYGQRQQQPIVNLSLQWQWGGNRQRQQNRRRPPHHRPPPRH